MVSPIVTQIQAGIQRQLLLQTRELAKRGRRVLVLQRDDPALRESPALREKWKHVTFVSTLRLPGGGHDGGRSAERVRGLIFILHGLLLLWKHRREYGILHAQQLYSPTILGALAKMLLGKKLVVKVTASGHMGELKEIARLPFKAIRHWAFRRIDHLICLSEQMREEVKVLGLPESIITVIPNSIDVPTEPASVPRPKTSPFHVLFTGRLSTEKSLETLLEAVAVLGRKGHAITVDLVGGPDSRRDAMPELQALAEAAPDEVRIRFHGYQVDTDPFYRSADVFVLPSLSEGMSNSLLEALAYGLPCVVSDIPPNRELVDPGVTGFVFPPGDSGALESQLELLIRDREAGGDRMAEMSAAARHRMTKSFSVDAVVDRIEELYLPSAPAAS